MSSITEAPWLLVAAIDFGTTFSGYAFSFKTSPENITMNKNWGGNVGFASYKTHTSVLTDQNGDFVDFGFDAEDKYAGALEDEDTPDVTYKLFRHFKMVLHKSGKLGRSTQIDTIDGKSKASALEIFAHALRYLKGHMLEAISKTTSQAPEGDMIRWVVTVPAIWTEESKQFMREAAFKAQLISTKDSRKLVIALEPEAASLCCRRMDIAKYPEGNVSIQTDTKYLVIDAGGGTVDITAHQVQSDGSIKELHTATGGAWGGTKVDQNLVDLLRKVIGSEFIDHFQKTCPQQWLVFMTNFEKLKKNVSLTGKCALNIQLTYAMDSEYKEFSGGKKIDDIIKTNGKSLGVGFSAGTIMIKEDAARNLFRPVIQQIIDHVKDLLSNPELDSCKLFFLVGGFSESRFLQEMIKREFQPRIQVLIPAEAQMAVIKGAVLFGHKPKEIRSRIMRKTYGCGVNTNFIDGLHPQSKQIVMDGHRYCDDVFKVFVSQGEEKDVGATTRHTLCTAYDAQTEGIVELYSLDRKPRNLDFIDDPSAQKLGSFTVETPGYGKGRPVHLDLTFSGTEIQIEAHASGQSSEARIDFMTN